RAQGRGIAADSLYQAEAITFAIAARFGDSMSPGVRTEFEFGEIDPVLLGDLHEVAHSLAVGLDGTQLVFGLGLLQSMVGLGHLPAQLRLELAHVHSLFSSFEGFPGGLTSS